MSTGSRQADALERMAHRLPDVIGRAAARAVAEVPGYSGFTENEIAEGIQRDLALATAALSESRGLQDGDREAMSIIGQTRAQQGLPLESMLQVYWITVDEVFAELWTAADEEDLDAMEVFSVAQGAWRFVGPMIEVAVRAYSNEQLEIAVADSQRLSALVHSLLHTPTDGNSDDVAALGLDPNGSYLAFRARRLDGDLRDLLLDLKLPGVLTNGLVAPFETDVIGLAAKRPSVTPSSNAIIAVGPAGRLHDLPRSFSVATRALETGVAFGRSGIVGIDDLALESMARTDNTLGDALVARLVTPLEPDTPSGAEILRTVRTFLDCELSADRTAAELFVHANTVRNRLHRFEATTGASLRSISDLAEIHLALLRASLPDSGPH